MSLASSLYIHIPFCPSICGYCDFLRLIYKQDWAFSYLEALFQEYESKYQGRKWKTIYIGGGTPNSLSLDLFQTLLTYFSSKLEEDYEWTIECNPELLTIEKARLMAAFGVNRVSMGMETIDSALLKEMGRHHDVEDVQAAVKILKEVGIDNISIDIIYALPNEDISLLSKDIVALLSLDVPHCSAYSYIQEEHSIWTRRGIKEAPNEVQGEQYEYIESRLLEAGYEHYEISSYARSGYQSKHNKAYWKDLQYGAIGLGASGYEGNVRYKNTSNLFAYLKGDFLGKEELIDKKDDKTYFLLTNLRLKEGFSRLEYVSRFQEDVFVTKKEIIDTLVEEGLLENSEERLSPTYQGMRLLDSVLLRLMD